MKPIPQTYNKNGFTYTLVRRTEHVALYVQMSGNQFVAYEVCRILRHDGRTIGGSEVPPAEYLPSTEQWGATAWTLHTLAGAEARFTEQHEHLTTLAAARATPPATPAT